MEQLRLCHMWWAQLDQDRFSEDERHKAALLMAAMRSLAFRQDALEHARLDLPAGRLAPAARRAGRGAARAGATRLRRSREGRRPLRARRGACPPSRSWPPPIRPGWTRLAQHQRDRSRTPRSSSGRVLVLIGLHHALVYAIHDCHARFNALDWRLWGAAHF